MILSNWSGKKRLSDLVVTLALSGGDILVFQTAELASGGKVTVQSKSTTGAVFVLDELEVGDAIVLR